MMRDDVLSMESVGSRLSGMNADREGRGVRQLEDVERVSQIWITLPIQTSGIQGKKRELRCRALPDTGLKRVSYVVWWDQQWGKQHRSTVRRMVMGWAPTFRVPRLEKNKGM